MIKTSLFHLFKKNEELRKKKYIQISGDVLCGHCKNSNNNKKMFTVKKFFKPIFIIFFKINKKDIAKTLADYNPQKACLNIGKDHRILPQCI